MIGRYTKFLFKRLESILSRKDNAVFVAECDGKVVGYIHVSEYEVMYAPKVINVLGLAVDENYRNNGIASALLNSAEEWARGRGISGVRLSSGTTRIKAHKFYEERGYSCDKTQLRFIKYFDGIID